jgi:hypothetical protein
LKVAETPEGTRVMLASDSPLGDYAARRQGERFVVTLPEAELADMPEAVRGSCFDDARIKQHEDVVELSFRVGNGVKARVQQNFSRLEIFFLRTVVPLPVLAKAENPLVVGAKVSHSPIVSNTARALRTEPVREAASSTRAPSDVEAVLEELRRTMVRVEQLEARVRELETERAARLTPPAHTSGTAHNENPESHTVTADVSSPAPAPAPAPAAQNHDDHDEVSAGPPRLQIQGYGDVNFRASNERGKTSSFSLGQLDLFLTSKLSEKFSVLSELIVEAGEDNAFSFEIHRLLLRYKHSDNFTLSVGRYHSSIGYWNTAFHHGSWFQTTVNRPFIFAFESKGGILPLHNVGLSATGRVPGAPLGLRYVAEIGNGRASRSPFDRAVQTAVDENNGKSYNAGLFIRPRQIPGFQAGVSVYRDRLTPRVSPSVAQTIAAGYIVFQDTRYEFLNEAIFLRHSTQGRDFWTPAFYTQFSRRFGNVRPFFRYHYVNVPADDPIFPATGRRNGPSVGLRYDVSEYVAFKAQYDHTSRRLRSGFDELILQLAFTF